VITIAADSPERASSEVASFTLTRDLGSGSSLSSAPDLAVYYSLGGGLNYSTGDFSLYPSPAEWPRICSAVIKAGEPSVTVIVQLAPKIVLNGVQTVEVAVTPYGVSPLNQVFDPKQWLYVVDWKHDRATLQFSRNPVAMSAVGTGSLKILSSGGPNTAPPLLELVRITRGGFDLFLVSGMNKSTDLPSITGSVSIGRYASGNADNEPANSIFLQVTDALNEFQTIALAESDLRATYGDAAIDTLKTAVSPLWGRAPTSAQKLTSSPRSGPCCSSRSNRFHMELRG